MTIKGQEYLYLSPDGVWQFQIYVPAYMRHMFGGKRLYRKSTGTRDIYKARHFRNHMLVEWNNLKEQFKPDTEDRRIQLAITSLHSQIRKNKNKPLIEERASSIPHLCLLRDEYATAYRDRRSLSTLSKSARAVEVFLQSIGKVDISLDQIGRRLVTDFIEEQQKRDVAGQTLQNWLTSLGSLYEFAKRRYDAIAPLNPFHGMNLEARRTIESYQPFEWHQLSTLLNEADEELRAVILFGLFSGARLDEIASLKKSDVVIVEGIQTFFISKSKTKAGVRHIPIHAFLIGMVDYYLSLNTGDYLLPQANKIERKDGKKGPFYSQAFTRLRRRVVPMATDRQCFHSLRGHFITCLDRAGVPEQRIGYITGHSSQAAATEAFKTYSAGCSMKELSDYVEMVDYPEIIFPETEKGA